MIAIEEISMEPQAASPTAVIDAESLAKIRTLLATETSDGVSLGLTLLESLGATAADLDAALAPPVSQTVAAVADGWLQGGEPARGEYDRYHRLVVAPRFVAQRAADRAAGRSFLELVKIAAGEFEMGSNEYDEAATLVHRVRITRAFLLGKTTVTQGQWWSVMGTLPWGNSDHDSATVEATHISWNDADEFCKRLTKLERASGNLRDPHRYRLPTEAEWEYACRAGTKTRFSFGDDESGLMEFAWCDDYFDPDCEVHEVGQKKPNPWGLHDMHGNICEWCSDWYGEDYYAKSPAADPEGPVAGSFRVLRGGCWGFHPVFSSCACRLARSPSDRFSPLGYGLRVVCELE